MSAAAELEARLGYRFASSALLRQALTHRSATGARGTQLDSNERLEFLGDRVLALLVAEWLVERFPREREGGLGKRFSVLVARDTLATIAERLHLSAAVRVPPAEDRSGVRQRARVLADALEALLGAVYLEGGLGPAREIVRREWEAFVGAEIEPPVSAKSRLQEHTLGLGQGLPEYRVLATEGASHEPLFSVSVSVAGREAAGSGTTKRAAEQAAAEAWLAGLPK